MRRTIERSVYSDTVTQGSTKQVNLKNLQPRPGGKYRYVYALLITLGGTLTKGGSAANLSYKTIWNILQSFTLKVGGKSRFNAYSGYGLIHRMIKMDQVVSVEQIANYMHVADVSSTGTLAQQYIVTFAPNLWAGGKNLDGVIPVSELVNNSDCSFTLAADPLSGSSTDIYSYTSATVRIDAYCVDLDAPIEIVHVEERCDSEATNTWKDAATGPRRITGLVVGDDSAGTDFTIPTAFSISVDGDIIATGLNGDDIIADGNQYRQFSQNTYGSKTMTLIGQFPRLSNEIAFLDVGVSPGKDNFSLGDVKAQHSGNCYVWVREQYRPSREDMAAIFLRQGVDPAVVRAYLNEVYEPSGNATVARVGNLPAALIEPEDIRTTAPVALRTA